MFASGWAGHNEMQRSLEDAMRQMFLASLAAAAGLAAMTSTPAAAQSKTLTGEVKTVEATVEAIETASRVLVLKKPDGTYERMYVPTAAERFSSIKVGDKLKARYYETVVLRVQAPGDKPQDTAAAGVEKAPGTRPAGTVSEQRTITATITDINLKTPSISFEGPNGWKYSSKVEDKKALEKVKVGDKVDITWTEAMLVSFEDASGAR
jgi:hypothetical protein